VLISRLTTETWWLQSRCDGAPNRVLLMLLGGVVLHRALSFARIDVRLDKVVYVALSIEDSAIYSDIGRAASF